MNRPPLLRVSHRLPVVLLAGLLIGLTASGSDARPRHPLPPDAAGSNSVILAIVNDIPLTATDVMHRQRLITLAHEKKASALEDLVDDTLKTQEAAQHGIHPSDADVDGVITNIARGNKKTLQEFTEMLEKSGIGADTLRKRIRAQMGFAQIVRARMMSDQQTSQRNAETSALANGQIREVTVNDYSLRRVVLTMPANPAPALVATRMKEASELRSQFTSCADGPELIKRYSQSVIIALGHRLYSDIPPNEVKTLDDVPIGGLTPPERSPAGIEMIAVCQRFPHTMKMAGNGPASLSDDELNAEGEQIAQTLLREARQRAVIVYPK